MPKGFENCVKRGGRVKRVSGPDKDHGLKKDEYVNYCYIDGKSYRGEVKKKKSTKNNMEESMFDENGKLVKVPTQALNLTEGEEAEFQFSEVDLEDGKKDQKLAKMTAYSGKTIYGHWLWGDLTIDVSGLENRKNKIPILEQHDVMRKIGFSKAPDLSQNKVELGDIQLLNTEAANEFSENSKAGFPYEASISAFPSVIEYVEEGETREVNGFSVKGPHTIFRKSQLKEASVAVFGWDHRTKSAALSEDSGDEFVELDTEVVGKYPGDNTNQNHFTEEDSSMNLDELKTKHPELYKQVLEEGKSGAQASFSQENQALMDELKSFKDMATQMQSTITALSEDQKKQKIELAEKNVKDEVDKIQATCLKETDIPEELHQKISIDHTNFVQKDENGVPSLKSSEFTEHAKAELKVWDDQFKKIKKESQKSIMGLSFSEEQKDEKTEFAEENDALTSRMLNHVGVKTEKQQ